MNKEKQLNRMIDMINGYINDIKETIEEEGKNKLVFNIVSYDIIELTTIIFTALQLTDITEKEIEDYLLKEINMTYENLKELEYELLK